MMETKYAILKTFKGKLLGTTGVLYDSKERADKICIALNGEKIRFSNSLNYRVVDVNL